MNRSYSMYKVALMIGTAIAIGGMVSRRLSNARLNAVIPHVSSGPAPITAIQKTTVIGATLTSFDEQGRSQILKITAAQPDPNDVAQEIYLYTVLYQHAEGAWQPLCQPDAEGMTKAIPLSGRWDQTGAHIDDGSITFACTNGALAKCVRWGYKPWKTVGGESLRDYHQACTRMVRADYCGDGISHTQNGIPIDVYDRLGIRKQSQESGMTFEAAWGTDGAIQVNRTRLPEAMTRLQLDCLEKLNSATQIPSHLATSRSNEEPQPLLFNDSFNHAKAVELGDKAE